jgi:hypothetical protein
VVEEERVKKENTINIGVNEDDVAEILSDFD